MSKDFSGQLRLRMPVSLHRQLSEEAAKEGVSLNSYLVYVLSSRNHEDEDLQSLSFAGKSAKENVWLGFSGEEERTSPFVSIEYPGEQ